VLAAVPCLREVEAGAALHGGRQEDIDGRDVSHPWDGRLSVQWERGPWK